MKQLLKAIGLWVLLAVAQHGAVVHELSHIAHIDESGLRVDSTAATQTPCELCPAYAQASAPTFSHAFVIPRLARVDYERLALTLDEAISAAVPTPRSRGPPLSIS